MVTFNVPSWVQGTTSTITNGNAVINRTYYTCTVEGAAFSGTMRLVKQGDGILNLPKVEQTYTGETNIWAGTVNFDGKLLQSPLWLNRFAQLNSDGGEFKSIQMDYASVLRPGRADNKGQLTVDSLMLGFGSRVVFDFYADLSADQLNLRAMKIETKNWNYGPQYRMPVFQFVYHGEGDPLPGKYMIGRVSTIDGNLKDIRIDPISTKLKAELTQEDGQLYLLVEGMRNPGTVIWMAGESNVWDVAATENFTNADDLTGGTDVFVTGDNVVFNDNAQQTNVNLSVDVEADSVIVANDSKAYTFLGSGALVGNTTLV